MSTKVGSAACALVTIAVLSGCAQKPEAIAPAYVSPTTYQAFNCDQLSLEASRLDAAYTRAAATQNKARQDDTVGVILLGLPTASLSGGNVADQIAYLKGHQDALHQTQISRSCIRVAPSISASPT